jgi:hypothetical protein
VSRGGEAHPIVTDDEAALCAPTVTATASGARTATPLRHYAVLLSLFAIAGFSGCSARRHGAGVGRQHAPSELLGTFADDYDGTHRIGEGAWYHGAHSTYHIVEWHADSQYLIARNGEGNRSDVGLWTRIDWLPLVGMPPYTWAFCLTAYKAPTRAAAAATPPANRATPRSGCAGFPFSRMRRVSTLP